MRIALSQAFHFCVIKFSLKLSTTVVSIPSGVVLFILSPFLPKFIQRFVLPTVLRLSGCNVIPNKINEGCFSVLYCRENDGIWVAKTNGLLSVENSPYQSCLIYFYALLSSLNVTRYTGVQIDPVLAQIVADHSCLLKTCYDHTLGGIPFE